MTKAAKEALFVTNTVVFGEHGVSSCLGSLSFCEKWHSQQSTSQVFPAVACKQHYLFFFLLPFFLYLSLRCSCINH